MFLLHGGLHTAKLNLTGLNRHCCQPTDQQPDERHPADPQLQVMPGYGFGGGAGRPALQHLLDW
jgi:hypothetical protein